MPPVATHIQQGIAALKSWLDKEQAEERKGRALGTAVARAAASGEDMEMIRTENLAVSLDFTQTGRIGATLLQRRAAGCRYTFAGDLLIAVDPQVGVVQGVVGEE